MNRWWRAYNEAVNDPKLQLLPDWLFRAWFNLMCMASSNGGKIPPLKDVAFTLRIKPDKAALILAKLHTAGLLDKTETGFEPHNWNGRQYKSDVSTERVQRFRNKKRNVSSTVSETPPETDTEPDTENKEREDTRARKLSTLPEDFALTPADIDAAHSVGMTDATIDAELKIFKAKKRSAGTKSADWSSEWTIWCERWKAMQPAKPTETPADCAALDYDKQLSRFKRGLPWNSKYWGPEPGQLGCRAPPELLAKHGLDQTH